LHPALIIKPGREKSLLRHHPWVFSGGVADVVGDPEQGSTVDLLTLDNHFLARGAYSPYSQIQARVWTWDENEPINEDFFRGRLRRAIELREMIPGWKGSGASRLVHAESDRLPGLIVDRYGDWLVIQALSSGIEYWRMTIASLLAELLPVQGIYERSDADVRDLEKLPERCGTLHGEVVPARLRIQENGLDYWVDIQGGHKTGFYLDQRVNRWRLRQLSAGKDVLDCFCYTGGFTVSALAGRANSVLAVDASAAALGLARENCKLNEFPQDQVEFLEGDVFHVLRRFRDMGRSFDLVVLDPPKFASSASQVEKAARGYKDINLLALKLLRPAGILVTFSCSGSIDAELFQRIIFAAAQDAGVDAQILERLFQAPDHPVLLSFPEGSYLKGLIVCKH